MKIKKILFGLVLSTISILGISQDYTYNDPVFRGIPITYSGWVIERGDYYRPGQLADGWDAIFNKMMANFIKLDTALQRVDAEITTTGVSTSVFNDSISARRAATVLNDADIASLVDSVDWMGDTLRAHNTRILALAAGGSGVSQSVFEDSIEVRRLATEANDDDITALNDSITWVSDSIEEHNTRLLSLETFTASTDSSWNAILLNPTSSVAAVEGQLYYDSDDNYLKVYDGSQWDTCNVVGSGGGGSTYTAGSGLYLAGSEFNLGDSITATDTLEVLDYTFTMKANSSGAIRIQRNSATNTIKRLEFGSDGLVITDGIDSVGIIYAGNYRSNFVDSSLVDKKYVDDAITTAVADTVQLTDITDLYQDTTLLWAWTVEDSSQMETSKAYGTYKHYGPDTMVIYQSDVICNGASSVNFYFNMHFSSDLSGADTDIFSSAKQVSGSDAIEDGEIDTPDTAEIPPGNYVWFTLSSLSTKPPDGFSISVIGYRK